MRIFWITNIILPEASIAFGLSVDSYGGWMSAQLNAIRNCDPTAKFYILTAHKVQREVTIGNTTYGTFIGPRMACFPDGIPKIIEDSIRAKIQEFCPDIIHIHGTENYYANLSKKVFCGCKVLVSLQGIINGYYPFYSGGLGSIELLPYKKIIRRLFKKEGIFIDQWMWQKYRAKQEEEAFINNIFFAGRTDWDNAWVRALNYNAQYYHLDEIMRRTFYNEHRSTQKVKKYSVYCSAAASYPLKGLHWLIRAAAILVPRYPELTIRIADSYGLDSNPKGIKATIREHEYKAYLRNLIRDLGLSKHIIALPQLTEEEVAIELSTAHVFCLPSLCENSPNSLCEAMLIGVPCIATYVGGVPSILKNEEEGLLCPPCDPASIASAIERLFRDDEYASRLGRNAKAKAKERHNPDRIARDTLLVYKSIMTQEIIQ